jgi:hypothetical protein
MKTKKTKAISTMLDFLNGCPNKTDIVYFTDPVDAYNYGVKVRENIENEDIDEEIVVDISGTVVRIKVIAEEPTYVSSGCE